MPNIKSYDAPALDIHPTEIGVESTAAAARRSGAFFNQAAQDYDTLGQRASSAIRDVGNAAVAYEDHREISAGANHGTTLMAGMEKKWNDLIKDPKVDPNDPSIAAKFREEQLEPALDQFKQGFTTEKSQQFAEHFVEQFRTHMFHKTTADMSSMAGQAVRVNHVQTVNSLSNAVHGDPSSLDFALRTLDSSTAAVIGSSPNITGAQAAALHSDLTQKGKEQIVRSAVQGAIEQNPEAGIKLSQDPRYSPYINGGEVKQFAAYARAQQRIAQSEARSDRVMQQQEDKTAFHVEANKLELSTIPSDAGDRVMLPKDYWQKVRQIGQMPGAAQEPGRIAALVKNGEILTERMNKPEPLARVSHETTMGLLSRIRASDTSRLTDNAPIYDAYQKGDLTNADFKFLTQEFSTLRTPEGVAIERDRGEFFKRYAPVVDGGLVGGVHSAAGSQQMYAAEMDARRQEGLLRSKGLDPHLVYDPRSEYFFGRPENLSKYQVSLQDAMGEMNSKGPPAILKPSVNLTGPGKGAISMEVMDIPPGMSPSDAIKNFKSGQRIRLPDGRVGTVP